MQSLSNSFPAVLHREAQTVLDSALGFTQVQGQFYSEDELIKGNGSSSVSLGVDVLIVRAMLVFYVAPYDLQYQPQYNHTCLM